MAEVVIQNLSKSYQVSKKPAVEALKNVNLTIAKGELLVLVGPSGSGKTTLLRSIAGLEEISEGTVCIDGQIINDVPPQERDVAMVFQNGALYPHMTVRENLEFGLRLRRFTRAEIEERLSEATSLLGLESCLDRRPSALSGGERQRVALGRALVRKPKLCLLDEPLSNLDAPLRLELRRELRKLQREMRMTMIYVTHDQAEALALGDRVAVLREGVVEQVDEPMVLYAQPSNVFVASFVGVPSMNYFNGRLIDKDERLYFEERPSNDEHRRGTFYLRLSSDMNDKLAMWKNDIVILGLRPEAISTWTPRVQETAGSAVAENSLKARVELIEPTGPETYLRLSTGTHVFTARVPAKFRPQLDEKVVVHVDVSNANFFDPKTGNAIR